MFTYKDLQDEVKRRATSDQGGTQFDIAIKNIINTSLFRVAREAPWRVLRRKSYFTTVTSYIEGSGSVSVTNSSTSVTVTGTGVQLSTDGVKIGRRVKFGTDDGYYIIRQFNAESTTHTTFTIDRAYEGTTSTGTTYEVLPQEEYNLPIQAGHRMFLWHEDYGSPYKLTYIPDQEFFESGNYVTEKDTPTHYRMWGEDMVITQMVTATAFGVYSSNASDTNIEVTVFGVSEGYPDSVSWHTHPTNGESPKLEPSLKKFTSIERAVKGAWTAGRLTIQAASVSNAPAVNVVVIPAGDVTAGIIYKKVQLYPLPTSVFDINCYYYKDPYRLVGDGDVHEMGQDFDEAIILLSVSKIKYQTDQKEGDRFFALYKDEIKNLRRTNIDKIDWFPSLQSPYNNVGNTYVHPNLMYRQIGPNYGPASR